MPDRAELDGLADQHRERELQGEPGEDNCPRPMTMVIFVDTNRQFCRGYPAQSKSCDGKGKITDAK